MERCKKPLRGDVLIGCPPFSHRQPPIEDIRGSDNAVKGDGTANEARRSDETIGALQTGLPGRANDSCGECGEATARRTGCQASKGFAVMPLNGLEGANARRARNE